MIPDEIICLVVSRKTSCWRVETMAEVLHAMHMSCTAAQPNREYHSATEYKWAQVGVLRAEGNQNCKISLLNSLPSGALYQKKQFVKLW